MRWPKEVFVAVRGSVRFSSNLLQRIHVFFVQGFWSPGALHWRKQLGATGTLGPFRPILVRPCDSPDLLPIQGVFLVKGIEVMTSPTTSSRLFRHLAAIHDLSRMSSRDGNVVGSNPSRRNHPAIRRGFHYQRPTFVTGPSQFYAGSVFYAFTCWARKLNGLPPGGGRREFPSTQQGLHVRWESKCNKS